MAALELDPAACRAHALGYSWEACTRQFVAALAQPPGPHRRGRSDRIRLTCRTSRTATAVTRLSLAFHSDVTRRRQARPSHSNKKRGSTMKNKIAATIAGLLAVSSAGARNGPPQWDIALEHLASIGTGSAGSIGAEIVAYDRATPSCLRHQFHRQHAGGARPVEPVGAHPAGDGLARCLRRGPQQRGRAQRAGRGRGRGESEDRSGPGGIHRCGDAAGRGQRGGGRAARHADLRRRRPARAGGERGRARRLPAGFGQSRKARSASSTWRRAWLPPACAASTSAPSRATR